MDPPSSFPLLQTLILCLCKVSEASVICFIMPFVYEMVASFGISTSSAARYAGLIESALVFTESLSAPFWGSLADKHGRKPLLVLGLMAFTVACVMIGLSSCLWQAILARCISGVLGAVAVLVRTVQFEITDSSSVDRVLEFLTPCWAIGAALGPMIGGTLANPAKTMPTVFTWKVWSTYPYLLPSATTALLPLMAAIGCWMYLPETMGRPIAEPSGSNDSQVTLNELEDEYDDEDEYEREGSLSMKELVSDPRLFYTLFVSALLAFVSMSYNAGFMMMASSPLLSGGLGLQPWQLGIMLALSSGVGILVGTYLVPALVSRYGWYGTIRITSVAHVALFPMIGVSGIVARLEGGLGWVTIGLLGVVLILYEIGETSFTGVDVAIADRCPRGCLATVNGLSLSAASIGRMLAPALSGLLWSLSVDLSGIIGHNLIWIIFTLVAIGWWYSTIRLWSPKELHEISKGATTQKITEEARPLLAKHKKAYGAIDEDLLSARRLPISASSSCRTLDTLIEDEEIIFFDMSGRKP